MAWSPQARAAAAAARKKGGSRNKVSPARKRRSANKFGAGNTSAGRVASGANAMTYWSAADYKGFKTKKMAKSAVSASAKKGNVTAQRQLSAIPAVKAPTRQKAMRTTPTAAAGATQPHAQAPKVVMPPGTINRVQSAAQMYGTGSKQHKAAKKRFGGTGGPYSPKH